jgi:hypothetical protein
MKRKILTNIKNLLLKVEGNNTGIYSKKPALIAILNEEIANIVGDRFVHISKFVIAKIKGLIPELDGHKEITDELFLKLPKLLEKPFEILIDTRAKRKFLFITISPRTEMVVEVRRVESGMTEINTFHLVGIDELNDWNVNFQSFIANLRRPLFPPMRLDLFRDEPAGDFPVFRFFLLASSSNADRPPLMNQMTLSNGRKRYGVSIARGMYLSIENCGKI